VIGRRALRFTLKLLLLAPSYLLWSACSSGGSAGSAGTAANGACQTGDDCTHWVCLCKDGSSSTRSNCLQQTCGGQELCTGVCDSRGGLLSVTEKQTVTDSPECQAFCNKIASLNCGGTTRCNTWFWCGLDTGECAEQKRAELQCEVDTGTWACLGTSGWSESAPGCPSAKCPADAGTDAPTD
jgi:hypothetical protein